MVDDTEGLGAQVPEGLGSESLLNAEEPVLAQEPAGPNGLLRLRGLPFSAAEGDIRAFFGQFELAQVFICKRNGRSSGEAFAQLVDPSVTAEALAQLNRQHMGPRYIELFEALEGDLATAKALTVDRLRGYVVRMRGLPYSASAADVLRFLNGVEVVRGMEGVILTWTPDGRPTGEAFVELKDEAAQSEAMQRHKQLMGTRYIELFTSTKAALVQAIQHNRLILGFTNRKRWLQQAGMSAQMLLPQQQGLYPMNQQMGRVDDMTDSFAGMNMGGQGMRPGMGPAMRQGGSMGMGQAGGGMMMQQGNPGGAMMVGRQDMRGGGMPYGHMQQSMGQRPTQHGATGMRSDNGQQQRNNLRPKPNQQQQGYMPSQQQQQQQQLVQQQQGYSGLQMGGQMGAQSMVVQQPYIIQQSAGGQYVTLDSGGYTGMTALGQQSQESINRAQQQGQYMNQMNMGNQNMQSYTLQTIQLPAGSNIQDYLQLTNAGAQELQAGTTYVSSNLQALNMQGLAAHTQDGSQHMLHQ